ncbi:MAG: DUF4139 domain-containing protein [Deltaproteobacteria bacterium]|nr:MAG: DUF4139 domain-containing protein [Deltaproteobacteria bacterium]
MGRAMPSLRTISFLAVLAGSVSVVPSGCAHRRPGPAVSSELSLDRVVLYRSGVAYFERRGQVRDGVLRLEVRKDEVDDVLKSLTIVDRASGRAVRASLPLDARDWATGALRALERGNLPSMLAALRGRSVAIRTSRGTVAGRVVLVEQVSRPVAGMDRRKAKGLARDHRVTVFDGRRMHVAYVSEIRSVSLRDRTLALHLDRRLDAAAGEGMFQRLVLEIELAGGPRHDLLVSYVAEAPMWKPTYRVVLPETRKGKALLQGWAVVDNVSGEDWTNVRMSLTAGAPISFRYDLHTPRPVPRPDLTEAGVRHRAAVAIGETTWKEEAEPPAEPPASAPAPARGRAKKTATLEADAYDEEMAIEERIAEGDDAGGLGMRGAGRGGGGRASSGTAQAEVWNAQDLARSLSAKTKATEVAGLTRFDLEDRLTVPAGTATLVALVNAEVDAEEAFLYRPGGSGPGFEQNPYRVVRVRNTTPFALEPGPMSIYAGGSFVGEGITEPVGAGASVTIPFAVEPSIVVESRRKDDGGEMRLVRFVRGVLEVESFARRTTTWTVRRRGADDPARVLVRHEKAGANYDLVDPPDGVERLPDAYLVPVELAKGETRKEVVVVEKTPSRISVSLWDRRAPELLDTFLAKGDLSPAERKALAPIVKLRQEIGRIDTEIEGLRRQVAELDRRAEATRKSLEAIKKDPRAGNLRARLSKRLDDFVRQGDALSRKIVELESRRLEKKIELEDAIRDLVIE